MPVTLEAVELTILVRRHLTVQQAPLLRRFSGPVHQIRLHRSSTRMDETYDRGLRCMES